MKADLIKEENTSVLLEKINYSIKSNLESITINKDCGEDGVVSRYHTRIKVSFGSGYSATNHYYGVSVKKLASSHFFGLFDNSKYYIQIDIETKEYSDKIEMEELLTTKIGSKIFDIWNTLSNAEEQKQMDLSNKRALKAIEDISTTIDKRFNRDETLDKILNKE